MKEVFCERVASWVFRECGKLKVALHEVKRVLRNILAGCIQALYST